MLWGRMNSSPRSITLLRPVTKRSCSHFRHTHLRGRRAAIFGCVSQRIPALARTAEKMKSAAPTLIIPRYIDASRTAQYLGITTQALYNLVARRFVPFRKMGKKLVFDVQELDAYIARLDGIGADEAADRILKEDAINLN